MSKRKTTRYVQNIEIEEFEDGNCDVFVIPQDDDPNDSESEDTDNSQNNMQVMSYSEVLNNYTENQSQLEPGYTYDWINGEKKKSQKDFWSKNPLLGCPAIANAMSRNKFLEIKSKIKYSKSEDKNPNDRAWRVRKIFEMFKTNSLQFGFFSTALSIDEMMVKFHGRTILLQFMKNKPARFGIKMWGLCNPEGYLFDCDIYCGKGLNIYSDDNKIKLSKCPLGSRVVMMMTQNPDLMIHLKTIGLKSTGTVRKNRVQTDNKLDNKASRGTIAVKHEKKSGLNFITVMDSQPVSLLSTAAGVEPLAKRKRYSKNLQSTNEIPFPSAINVYNDFMGGVDMHDEHCSNLMPFIRAKKWTWPMFLRLIQSSLTNALVIYNLSHSGEKLGSFDMALAVAEHYIIKKADEKHILFHEKTKSEQKKNCKNFTKCSKRTTNMCIDCDAYFCDPCFKFAHKNM
uniref:PiggyBac transposable element-derived protein domain-containing protein n=1 Tax=Trichogramma kaykai TaxID=54128 RepID=A0ABD2WJL6_9HYME